MGVWREIFPKIPGYAGWHTLRGVLRGDSVVLPPAWAPTLLLLLSVLPLPHVGYPPFPLTTYHFSAPRLALLA